MLNLIIWPKTIKYIVIFNLKLDSKVQIINNNTNFMLNFTSLTTTYITIRFVSDFMHFSIGSSEV